jgi:hypothetical protein
LIKPEVQVVGGVKDEVGLTGKREVSISGRGRFPYGPNVKEDAQ